MIVYRHLLCEIHEGAHDGPEFIIEAYNLDHAKRNADYYHANIVGRLYEPFGRMKLVDDSSYDWAEHTVKRKHLNLPPNKIAKKPGQQLITFTVQGTAWRKEISVDCSLFDDYEALAFEAMTQSITHFYDDDYEITDLHDFPSLPWFLLAFETGHERNTIKRVVALTEYVLRNAGRHTTASEAKEIRLSIQKEQESD